MSYLTNPYRYVVESSPELEVGSTGGVDTVSTNFLNLIEVPESAGGVIGNTYNSIAMSITTPLPGGNYKLGAYDDNSGEPDVLYEQTGNLTPDDGYTFRTVTDFNLDTAVVWLGHNHSTGVLSIESGTAGTTWDRRYKIGFNYGSSMPNPAGTGFSTLSTRMRMKLALLWLILTP